MKWTTFMPVLNEADIIESKIENCIGYFGGKLVVVEGSIPQTYNVGPDGLSTDGTSEILKSYADRIVYLPVGKQPNRMELQNHALAYIHKHLPDTEILHRTDADEFETPSLLIEVEKEFESKNIWMLYTDLINLIDPTKAGENIAPQGHSFPFAPGIVLKPGLYHERFYRYRNDLFYINSAHCLSDSLRRPLFAHPDYYFNRSLLPDERILHYKYIDGFNKILKAEMSYLAEDEHMQPYSPEIFEAAKQRVKRILQPEKTIPIALKSHPIEVQKSKWFKYEPWNYDFNITFDEFMERM